MGEKPHTRRDLLLLLSLVLVILTYPVLDHGEIRRVILGGVLFVPVILTTVRMSQIKAWVWPSVMLMSGAFILAVADTFLPNRMLTGMKWGMLTVFFGYSVAGLFNYLRKSGSLAAHISIRLPVFTFAWNAMVCALQCLRCFSSRCFPTQRRCGNRSSGGTFVLQFGDPFDGWLRRHSSTARRGAHVGGTGGHYGCSLHCNYGGATRE